MFLAGNSITCVWIIMLARRRWWRRRCIVEAGRVVVNQWCQNVLITLLSIATSHWHWPKSNAVRRYHPFNISFSKHARIINIWVDYFNRFCYFIRVFSLLFFFSKICSKNANLADLSNVTNSLIKHLKIFYKTFKKYFISIFEKYFL